MAKCVTIDLVLYQALPGVKCITKEAQLVIKDIKLELGNPAF